MGAAQMVVFLLLGTALYSSRATTRFYRSGNATLGVILPVHSQTASGGCGELYTLGLGYIEAISYAIERINNSTDILPGISLGLDVRDYCYNSKLAMQWAYSIVANNDHNELVRQGLSREKFKNLTDPIVAVIGSIESSSTAYVAGLFQVVDMPIVSPFASSEELSSPYYSSFFRTVAPDGEQSKAMADIIEHFKWAYVAAIAHDGSYGQYGVRALEREAYDRKTFCISFVEFFTRSGYKGKIETIVRKIKRASNIKVIVFWSNFDQADVFLEEALKQKLNDRTFLLSEAMATFGMQIMRKYTSVLGGSLAILPHEYRDLEFENHLRNLTPEKTRQMGNPWWEEYWKGEGERNPEVRRYDTTEDDESDFKEVWGAHTPYVTDAVYAVAHSLDKLYRTTLDTGRPFNQAEPSKLLLFMRNLTFRGVTGNIRFEKSGNPTNAYYDVMNFRKRVPGGKYFIEKVGFWKRDQVSKPQLQVNGKLIQWKTDTNAVPTSECSKKCPAGTKQSFINRCCWECFQCSEGTVSSEPGLTNCTRCSEEQMSNKDNTECVSLPLQNIKWEDTTAAVVLLLTGVGFALNLIVLGVFIRHHDTPVVKGSNQELSYLLLFIISLSLLMPILHLAHPTAPVCYLVQPWRYLTCTACVSVLFLKTNRLVRAFQTTAMPHWFRTYILDRKRQLVVVFFLNLVQFILTLLWLALDPPHVRKDITFQKHMFLRCLPYTASTGLIIRAVMFSYFIFMSLLCTLYAFKARKLPDNFNEARYIGFSLYVLLVSWIAYYPVDSALEGFYTTIVASATALLIGYGLLGCLFLPKAYIILRHPEQNTVESVSAEVGKFSLAVSSTSKSSQGKINPST
ncbi:extracellular calcium-sensing receptor [Nematostella vectensis]|nr:extracellular calcium-sensing receptor [Nematostella vectensis]